MPAGFVDLASELTSIGFLVVLEGEAQASGTVIKDITPDGVPGREFKEVGYHGNETIVTTIAGAATSGAAATLQVLYAQYKGHLVTFTDDKDNVWLQVMVLDVQGTRVQRIAGAVGIAAGYNYLVTATWRLMGTYPA